MSCLGRVVFGPSCPDSKPMRFFQRTLGFLSLSKKKKKKKKKKNLDYLQKNTEISIGIIIEC